MIRLHISSKIGKQFINSGRKAQNVFTGKFRTGLRASLHAVQKSQFYKKTAASGNNPSTTELLCRQSFLSPGSTQFGCGGNFATHEGNLVAFHHAGCASKAHDDNLFNEWFDRLNSAN